MFFGMFNITISDDGMLHLFRFFERQIEVGIAYSVIVSTDEKSKGINSLIYRFSNKVHEGEELIKTYKVRKDKVLRIPPAYRKIMAGKCVLTGLCDDIELVTAESQKMRESGFSEIDIDALIEEIKSF